MSTGEFVIFQKYNDQTSALELEALLKEQHVECILEESAAYFSPTFVTNDLEKEFTIKLKKTDFERVEKLIEKSLLKQINSLKSDYHLFDYKDDELMEIIKYRYEWNQFDFILAQKILKERGKQLSPEELEIYKDNHLSILAAPEKSDKAWIVTGYVFAFLGGVLGILIGLLLYSYKKTLPTGDVVYVYSKSDRKHGVRIFIIGSAVFCLLILSRIIDLF